MSMATDGRKVLKGHLHDPETVYHELSATGSLVLAIEVEVQTLPLLSTESTIDSTGVSSTL